MTTKNENGNQKAYTNHTPGSRQIAVWVGPELAAAIEAKKKETGANLSAYLRAALAAFVTAPAGTINPPEIGLARISRAGMGPGQTRRLT